MDRAVYAELLIEDAAIVSLENAEHAKRLQAGIGQLIGAALHEQASREATQGHVLRRSAPVILERQQNDLFLKEAESKMDRLFKDCHRGECLPRQMQHELLLHA